MAASTAPSCGRPSTPATCTHGPVHLGRAADPHPAEAIVDVEATSAWLDGTKAVVAEAVREEVRRAVRAAGRRGRIRLNVTRGMVKPLEDLYAWAWHEAYREMARMGLGALADTVVPGDVTPAIRPVVMRLAVDLERLEGRVEREVREAGAGRGVAQVIGTVPSMAAARLASVPGALDAVSYLVTPTYTAGLDDVYRANAELFGGYLYSAVLDRGTCSPCRGKDGTEYATLDEAEVDLPGFGPNPACRGGSRCRCRLIPLPPEGGPARAPVAPPPPPVAPEPEPVPTFKTTDEAAAWIVAQGYAPKVSLPGFNLSAMQEAAEGLHDTLGRYGVQIQKLTGFSRRRPGTNAVFARITKESETSGWIEMGSVLSTSAKAAKRRADGVAAYSARRESLMEQRRRQVADTTRPQELRDAAANALERLEAGKRWTIANPEGREVYSVIVHESGHAIDYAHGLQDKLRAAMAAREVSALDRLRVSEYATTNDAEMFAETFAAYVQGIELPPAIRESLEEVLRDI